MCEPFSPYTASFTRHTPAHLLSGAGSALLATQRAGKHALDVQRRQPAARDRIVSREAAGDQTCGDLDDTGTVHLVHLRGASVEPVSQFDSGTRWWIDCRDDGSQQSAYGPDCMALGLRLVSDDSSSVAFCHAAGVEREPRARGATGMGPSVRFVLSVLARVDRGGGGRVVVVRIAAVEYLAR